MTVRVEVPGPGCRRCSELLELVREVARAECPDIEARYVTDPAEIVAPRDQRLARTPSRSIGGSRVKKIEVLGSGCNNCKRLEQNAREAVALAGIDAKITHVTDYAEIMSYGIMSTPGLVIDGKVVSYGRVPSAGDIAVWLSE